MMCAKFVIRPAPVVLQVLLMTPMPMTRSVGDCVYTCENSQCGKTTHTCQHYNTAGAWPGKMDV